MLSTPSPPSTQVAIIDALASRPFTVRSSPLALFCVRVCWAVLLTMHSAGARMQRGNTANPASHQLPPRLSLLQTPAAICRLVSG